MPRESNKKESQSEAGTADHPESTVTAFPLFFKKPHVITDERHAKARMRSDMSMLFAKATNCIPVMISEIAEAAKHYPIAFMAETPCMPLAIVGLEQENYFIDEKNHWLDRCYVPAYVRKYPFVFSESPGSDQLTLCLDEVSLADKSDTNARNLYENGEPTALVRSALDFCAAYQRDTKQTRIFCQA